MGASEERSGRGVDHRHGEAMSRGSSPPPGSLFVGTSEMAARMRAVDWAATPVGPVADWPASLRTAVGICLSSRYPMVIWWGPELALLYNDAWIPILGPAKHPALGRPGADVWPEMWHIIGEQLRSVLDTGEATWSDDQLLPANRFGYLEEAYFTYSYSAIHDEHGRIAGAFTAVTETTGRVLGERRLATLRQLGELSAVGAASVADACAAALDVVATNRADVPFAEVHLLDDDGGSARLVASFGVRPGSRIAPTTLPDPDSGRTLWRVATTGRGETATGIATRYAGGIQPGASPVGDAPSDMAVVLPLTVPGRAAPIGVITLGVSPYRALDEEYRSFLDLVAGHVSSAASDATAYEAERRRAEALAELDRAKTEFFSNVSHEFRTPLTLLLGPVEELLAAPTLDEQRVRADLDVVHRNGLRLRKLVDSLLDFSRLQAGRLRGTFRPVDLAAATSRLAGLFAEPAQAAGLRLHVDCPELGEPVWVDREMWEQVMLNLLSNALKFTFEGSITVRLRRESGAAVLTVRDTGIGIPAAELPLLFDRFHRVDGARARSAEGSGIGLALVRELVALHGGTLGVESEVDVGTTFSVTVPFGRAHLPAGQVADPAGEPAGTSGAAASYISETRRWLAPPVQPPEPADPGRPHVLVADDNADMREYLTTLLVPHYRVRTASDGRAALDAATAEVPDLILTDAMMPAMDGFALLAALRADPRTAGVPVLLLSARAGEEAAVEGLSAGADDYLVKPFSSTELLARVRAHLQAARSRRREAAWRAAMVEALLDGFYVVDDRRAVVEVNEAFRTILGYGPEDMPQRSPYPWWPDREREPREYRQVVEGLRRRSGRVTLPMRHRDGRRVWCDIAFSTVTDPESGRESRVGTIRDVTAEHAAAEQLRGRAAADRTARDAAEGVSAQLRTLVEGLAAVVWEADARTWRVSFVSERVEEVLGYQVRDWMADEAFWPSLIDPRDREGVLHRFEQAIAAGEDFELVYRVTAADGRTVWLQDLVHVLTGTDGAPERLQGVMIDVTQRERTRQASALLAEVGRLQAEPGSLVDGLAALLTAAVPALADLGVVSLLGPDGLLAPVAAVRPGRPEVAQAVLDMPPYPLSPHFEDAYAAGRPFVVQTPTDVELRALSAGETDYEGRRQLGIRAALVVPLEAARRLLGTLSFVSTERVREHDAADLALAGELGQRVAVAVERARLATRERHLVELTAALAAAGTVAEAARALVGGIIEVLDATAGAAYLAHPAHGMRIVHSSGYPDVILAHYGTVRLDAVGPVGDCARERRSVWLRDDDDWASRYPGLLGHHAETGNIALMVVPLVAGERVVGVMAASFGTRRVFDADERRFAETIAVQAAQAFERAALADVRREIAETLAAQPVACGPAGRGRHGARHPIPARRARDAGRRRLVRGAAAHRQGCRERPPSGGGRRRRGRAGRPGRRRHGPAPQRARRRAARRARPSRRAHPPRPVRPSAGRCPGQHGRVHGARHPHR
jgi:PAS domain S-box-containing protein